MNKAELFFTDEEKKKIIGTVSEVESKTSGEVAVMVVDSSDRYREAEVSGAFLLSGLGALVFTELLILRGIIHEPLIWYYIPLCILLLYPFLMLLRHMPDLKLGLIPARRRNEAVARRALRAFYEKGLHRTRDNTGVLFFISLYEHKVWVLADKGIYEQIDQETLNKYATTVTRGIKEGRAAEALCSAIAEVGEILSKHFPVKPDDMNELSNEVMTE